MSLGHQLKLRTQWWLILLAASVLVIVLTADRTMLRLDNAFYDRLLQLGAPAPGQSVLMVEIDDDSIARLGRWPWNRGIHAALIDRIKAGQPRAIAYDVLFTEPGDPAVDALLAGSIAAARPIFLPMVPPAPGLSGVAATPVLPIAPVRQAASGIGYATIDPDADGVVRSATVAAGPAQHLMALAALAAASPATPADHLAMPVGARLIPFGAGGGHWPGVSAAAVLAGQVPPELLRDRVVLVGATATGLGSRYPTPTGSVMSGLEIEANLVNGLISRTMIRPAGMPARIGLGLMPLLVLMIGLGPWRRMPAMVVFALCAGVVVAIAALCLLVWRLWLPPGAALAGLAVAYPLWGWRQLAVIEQFMRVQLLRLEQEPSILPRVALVGSVRHGVAGTIALLHAAIARNREMQHFVADRLDQLPDATLVADLPGRIVMANAAAHRLFTTFGHAIIPGATQAQALLSAVRLVGSGNPVPFPPEAEEPATHEVQRDQAHFYLVGMAPQTQADGQRAGWIIRFVDISESKAAQRQRDDVVQLLTHDMRSPQASILAVLETAPADRIAPVEASAIRHYAERTLRLADGFVQLARAEYLEYTLEEVDLGDMLIDAIDDLWPQSRAKAIEIVTHGDEQMLVMGERSLLTRALGNVIGNAIKYSPDGTTITCTLTRQVRADGSAWGLCTIADQGCGMDEDLRARMFERFARGPVGLGPKTSGAGLGLSFVHTVMVRHHGVISCETEPGKGTTFTLALPIKD
ncbi:CHASE2 domain-containing protein [Novosphingobium sp. BK486]|uniref:CHASE2 domain-containing protein n=1 Tax=unclassified Novosphingobium TaxID=2644732 RepID=UPI0017CFC703|nr:CHASE2 domain-containing sensor protein/signal transduction histidine kinase [Novosphingobium sp. BK256]MBB3373863.1 CHASE2 domain-containing sensor protein/signal transduction histidine kinase [Novosphingobium sp. BK280]MBB3378275.1 CHASE2 domain-containing sensor protein/signal transduction histidine kinase [Novosphingobium sp. BK258]MBB3419941.1 CHASE2 domain-containing sensor protein/signal transduction histidine kinase [Novosphingobium sp. BK267]MBB3447738.1 CHASE2 domain-containing sen